MSGEGGMVGGVLVTRGFAGRIALRVQNRPPGAESPSRCGRISSKSLSPVVDNDRWCC